MKAPEISRPLEARRSGPLKGVALVRFPNVLLTKAALAKLEELLK